MNKKAFLAGDTLIYVYSIIALAVIAVLFFFLFSYLTIEELSGIKARTYTLEENSPNIRAYNYLPYYLNTKFKVENKETSLIELIPLYCYDKNKERLSYIERASSILIGEGKINIWCDLIDSKCTDKSVSLIEGVRHLEIDQKNIAVITNKYADILNPVLFFLPFDKINVCIEAEFPLFNPEKIPEYVSSEKVFIDKVQKISEIKSKTILGISNNQDFYLISPTKHLWYYNVRDRLWCNLVEQNYQVCQKFSSEELIQCKGDYLCLQ